MKHVLDKGFVALVQTQGHAGIVVDSARCSFGSTGDDLGEKDQRLIRYLSDHGHTSPFRHLMLTFHVKAPLFVFRQWWKYQVGSSWREYETQEGDAVAFDIQVDTDQGCTWNELSGRYKVLESEFYVPEHARKNTGKQTADSCEELDGLLHHIRAHQSASIDTYNLLLEGGMAREMARLVLPPTIYSECFWTVSLQGVLHFLDQRLHPDAQYEIRQYAHAVLDLIRPTLRELGL